MSHFTKPLSLINSAEGLTKREYFAAIAMQSLLDKYVTDEKYYAKRSVEIADALINALNEDMKKKIDKIKNIPLK